MRWGVILKKSFYLLAIIPAISLSACSVEPVTLRHQDTGQVVRCAPGSAILGYSDIWTYSALNRCVEDYEAYGFHR